MKLWQAYLTPKLSPPSVKLKAWFILSYPDHQTRTQTHTWLICPWTLTSATETQVHIETSHTIKKWSFLLYKGEQTANELIVFNLPSDLSEDSGAKTEMKSGSLPPIPPIGRVLQPVKSAGVFLSWSPAKSNTHHSVYFIPCNTDYDEGPVEKAREAELSEDTDCDGSSLPEDSPEVQIRHNQACVGKI